MATKPLKSLKFPTLDDTYTVPQVDDTLAVQGAAADAKKVGDELTDIKEDMTQLTGEQTLDLSSVTNQTMINLGVNYKINYWSNANRKLFKHVLEVQSGKNYKIVISNGSALASSASIVNAIADASEVVKQIFNYTPVAGEVTEIQLTPTADGYLYLGADKNYTNLVIYGGEAYEKELEQNKLVKELEYVTGETIEVDWADGYITTNGSVGSIVNVESVTTSATSKHSILSVNEGDIYTLTVTGGSSLRAWCITDDEYKILANSGIYCVMDDTEIQIPENGAYLILNNDISKQIDPVVKKGRIVANRIADINDELSVICENEIVKSKKDAGRWVVVGSYLRRSGYVLNNELRMVSVASNLRVGASELGTGVIGYWSETAQVFVDVNSATRTNIVDFITLRKKYPTYSFFVDCYGITDASYPASSIDIYYIPYEYYDGVKKNYMEMPLNSGDWVCQTINRATGAMSLSDTYMFTTDYVPDYWSRIINASGTLINVYGYDSTGAYQGALISSGFQKESNPVDYKDIDLDEIRAAFPNYRIKLRLSSTNMDISTCGTVVVDKDKYDAVIAKSTSYEIPTRFTRTVLYSRDIALDGLPAASINGQGFCTDGTYMYAAVLKGSNVIIMKIDTDGELVAENNVGNIGHANQLAYDPNSGNILVASGNGTNIYTIDPSTLELGEPIQMAEIAEAAGLSQIWNIAYDEEKNIWLIGSGATFAIVSADFTNVYRILRIDNIGGGARQMVYPVGDYVFHAFAEGNFSFSATDWDGKTITTFNAQRTASQTIYTEFEAFCVINGEIYVYWNKAGGAHVTIAKETINGYDIVPVASVQKKFHY